MKNPDSSKSKSPLPLKTMCYLLLGAFSFSDPAHAMTSNKINVESLNSFQQAAVTNFVNTEVRADLKDHLNERIQFVAESALTLKEPPMSRETEAVISKGIYMTLASKAPFMIDEAKFDKSMAAVMDWLANHHVVPQAITVGVMARKTIGAGITVGGNVGAEANFYLKQGRLMMTNYKLVGAQVGTGTPVSDEEFYVALCFGSCYGGDPKGWYVGFDGEVAGGLGAGFFLEVGVDVGDLFLSLVGKKHPTLKDMYEASTVYVGFGFSIGLGAGVAGNLYHYSQIGPDQVLADLGATLNPDMISKSENAVKLH